MGYEGFIPTPTPWDGKVPLRGVGLGIWPGCIRVRVGVVAFPSVPPSSPSSSPPSSPTIRRSATATTQSAKILQAMQAQTEAILKCAQLKCSGPNSSILP